MSLVSYEDSGDDTDSNEFKVPDSMLNVIAAPNIDETIVGSTQRLIDIKSCKELTYNPRYEELYRPELGPANPKFDEKKQIQKNFLTGSLEPTFMSETTFEIQRKNFHVYGVANDPSIGASVNKIISKVGFKFIIYS